MNRRELLASFLGIPLAAMSGCGIGTPKLPPKGGLTWASSALTGHALRDGVDFDLAPREWSDVEVVIVGGGIAGLSAARRLSQAGVEFVLLELESEPGGTSFSGESSVVAYPWGAHYLPVPMPHDEELIELLDEVGVVEGRSDDGGPVIAEQFLCRDPQERVFVNGKWQHGLYPYEIADENDVSQFEAFQHEVGCWISWRDEEGRRAFIIPTELCSRDPEVMALDQLTMGEWMRSKGLTSEPLRWYVDYCCRDDFGLTVDQTSAWAGIFYFASRKQDDSATSQPFITWPEGNGRLVRHLRDVAGERILSSHAVRNVKAVVAESEEEQEAGTKRIEVTAMAGLYPGPMFHAKGWRARRVIFAAPPFLAPYLIDGFRQDGPSSIAEFTFGSWLVANLHLSNRPQENGFPMSWDNVLYKSPSLGYVTATHQALRDHGPTVLTYYYPLCDEEPTIARKRLLDLNWEQCAEIVLSDLERAHPEIRDLTEGLDVMRWGHAMVRPVPGLISGSARAECSLPFLGIHFAHSALSGVALFEEAFHHGNRAADEVLEALNV